MGFIILQTMVITSGLGHELYATLDRMFSKCKLVNPQLYLTIDESEGLIMILNPSSNVIKTILQDRCVDVKKMGMWEIKAKSITKL